MSREVDIDAAVTRCGHGHREIDIDMVVASRKTSRPQSREVNIDAAVASREASRPHSREVDIDAAVASREASRPHSREVDIDAAVASRHSSRSNSQEVSVDSAMAGRATSSSRPRTWDVPGVDIDSTQEASQAGSDGRGYNHEVDIDAVVAMRASETPSAASNQAVPRSNLREREQRTFHTQNRGGNGQLFASSEEDMAGTLDNGSASRRPPELSSVELLQLAETDPSEVRSGGYMEQLVALQHLPDSAVVEGEMDAAEIRAQAAMAISLVIEFCPDDETEATVWELLQHVWAYCELLRQQMAGKASLSRGQHAATISTTTELMRISYEPAAKPALRSLGALRSMVALLQLDHLSHPQARPRNDRRGQADTGSQPAFNLQSSMRAHAVTVLCNLLIGHPEAKEELATTPGFLENIKNHFDSPVEELVRVSGVLLQNLSFRVGEEVKSALGDANLIPAMVRAANNAKHRNAVLALTSALWNMSAHTYQSFDGNNKAAICSSPGALELLVRYLDIREEDKSSMAILHNVAGILQNVSSYIARQPALRLQLRQLDIYPALSRLLRRRNAEVAVRNGCGLLWNLSGASDEEREAIRRANLVPLLETLASGGTSDKRTMQNACHILMNLNLVLQPRSSPERSTVSADALANLSGASPRMGRTLNSSPAGSGDLSVMDSTLLHKHVPSRPNYRREERIKNLRQSRDDIRAANSQGSLRGSSDSVRHSSSENMLSRQVGMRGSSDSFGVADAPQKPPRRRASNDQDPSPKPFFHPHTQFTFEPPQDRLGKDTHNGPSALRHRLSVDAWHARSQSDSAACFTTPPSNNLRSRDRAVGGDVAQRGSQSSSVGSASSLRGRYTTPPHSASISPHSSQEFGVRQGSSNVYSPPSGLGSLGELAIRKVTQI